jgi:polyphosphate glucokinase
VTVEPQSEQQIRDALCTKCALYEGQLAGAFGNLNSHRTFDCQVRSMAAARSFRVKSRDAGGVHPVPAAGNKRTLTIDIGGTGIKILRLDGKGQPLSERARELTPQPAIPQSVIEIIKRMLGNQGEYDRVSVGFPGVVIRGVVHTAPNLGTADWLNFDLEHTIEEMTGKPTRAVNDVDLQGYGVIRGSGVELVFTLGTGLGSALYSDGHLVPNLEIAHHVFNGNSTYEDRVSNRELKRIGRKKWNRRVREVIEQLEPILNYDLLHVGGGNAKKLIGDLPPKVRVFDSVEGLAGGIQLWNDEAQKPALQKSALQKSALR